MQKKVVFVGPFSFSATLRLIRQSYANFKIQSNVHKIVTFIKDFEKEYEKYSEEFLKIGTRIDSLSEQFNKVESTRTKALTKIVEKIKSEEPNSLPAPEHHSTPLLD